jgi:hypothetical protein
LTQQLGDESVLLNLENERCFGLDDVGTRMWEALTTSPSIQEALETLSAYYDVNADQLCQDLLDLVHQLASQEIVSMAPEGPQDLATAS